MLDHGVAHHPFLLFLDSDVIEKAWPQQLLLNKKGFTPNSYYPYRNNKVVTRLTQGCDKLVI